MTEQAIKAIREATIEKIHYIWVRTPNLRQAVEIGMDMTKARHCAPEDLVAIAQKYGVLSMSAQV